MAGEIVGLLLAAGQGRRFGGDKLLHPLPDGMPIAVAAARQLREACPRGIAVLRPEQRELAGLLQTAGLETVFCAAAVDGMGHSLAAAVAASMDAAGWVVALADMPFVQPDTLRRVVAAISGGAALVAPVCAGRRGHPVGFAARWRDELLSLVGDEGARAILVAHKAELLAIETDDAGCLRDVDTRADLPA